MRNYFLNMIAKEVDRAVVRELNRGEYIQEELGCVLEAMDWFEDACAFIPTWKVAAVAVYVKYTNFKEERGA